MRIPPGLPSLHSNTDALSQLLYLVCGKMTPVHAPPWLVAKTDTYFRGPVCVTGRCNEPMCQGLVPDLACPRLMTRCEADTCAQGLVPKGATRSPGRSLWGGQASKQTASMVSPGCHESQWNLPLCSTFLVHFPPWTRGTTLSVRQSTILARGLSSPLPEHC